MIFKKNIVKQVNEIARVFFSSYTNNTLMKGFTLIELLIIFSISSMVVGISVNSFTSYNNSQVYNQSLSEFVNTLNNTRSRAISQVKPSYCGSLTLEGFEVRIEDTGQEYEQYVFCGGAQFLIEEERLPSQLRFVSGSAGSVFYNVGQGTVTQPRSIAITGFGKTSTITVSRTGIATINNGSLITPVPTSGSSTPTPTSSPSAAPPPPIVGGSFYSDFTSSKSGASGTVITVQARNARPNAVYSLIMGTDGGNSAAPCSQNVSFINASNRVSNSTGFIDNTSGSVSAATGTWQICFRETSNASITYPVLFTVTSSSITSAPTPTASAPTPTATPTPPNATSSPVPPTATSTPAVYAETSVTGASSLPNPSSRFQSVTFSATVVASRCTLNGYVGFYADGSSSYFTAASISGTGTQTVNAPYTFNTAKPYSVQARYVSGSTCPSASSGSFTHTVN
jgi:type II secretory pathway pseudopilin PulG